AAPMHDLGKLTIENSILNKPDKLTNEEYEIMKTHSSKSGEMVMILLDGVEEEHFVTVAYNVARYHHERWDGRGYPEGLVGSMIPIEARIMAVADVYDALCSKRSYKEGMPADKAARIMLDGMGTQFDPALKPIFMGCRGRLEAYYADAALEYALQ
ncbi:MAG: HD domain-containing phosphohydrolase, partial [Butyrivibrio hungatei]|nr:HD domain-containing phosphohydrolase [Butyrivibrio hungatei]